MKIRHLGREMLRCLPGTPIADVARLMRDTDASALIVLDGGRTPQGIVHRAAVAQAILEGLDLSEPIESLLPVRLAVVPTPAPQPA